MTANPVRQLLSQGQSPWLDFIRRSFIEDGSLARMLKEDGLGGVTSNPAIFEKAMAAGTDYDSQFRELAAGGTRDAAGLYEAMAVTDIRNAAGVLRPVFDASGGRDGFVSLEVSPYLARDAAGTIAEARRLWAWVDRPNLMVKVPGTPECVPAIRTLIEDGININVTLLFSVDAYKAVAEAYVAGLEARRAAGKPLGHISSVASFFISRIDAQVDKKIDARVKDGDPQSSALLAVRGKVAIASAKQAFAWYQEFIASPRWDALRGAAAQPQRLLWASTGTKDKTYSDVRYVEELIGPETVNTIPPATMDAFRDHGRVRATLAEDLDAARAVLAEADRLGLDVPGVTSFLVDDGVTQFAEAADALLGAVAGKRTALCAAEIGSLTSKLPGPLQDAVAARLESWRKGGLIRKLWAKHASVWTNGPEAKWLGWLDIAQRELDGIVALETFQRDVAARQFSDVLLLGMGGSSLGPEVFGKIFGEHAGFPRLHVLDSTDPHQVRRFENAVHLPTTLVIVASKSGGTLEPNILKDYFWSRMTSAVGTAQAGSHFVAITDPGSHLQKLAETDGFWRIFYGDPQIGGRYSVLSPFGLVPAAACGIDVRALLEATLPMVQSCSAGTPPADNPGVLLGTILGEAALAGRDKITITGSLRIAAIGAWMEQLIAESTGKHGHGLIPIDGETLAPPASYGNDRLFVVLQADDGADADQAAALDALEKAGHPVVRVHLHNAREIGQQFFLWEIATAICGSIMGIDPFDQPDVEASKIKTRALTDEVAKSGSLPPEAPFAVFGNVALFADPANSEALRANSLEGVLARHFGRVKPGDYVGLLAYIDHNTAHMDQLQSLRLMIRDHKHVATAAEFGPRFLHSTGQAYKGGPDSGVFLQITQGYAEDLPVPGAGYSFGTVIAAQARGDFEVLAERGRRALRVHLADGDLAPLMAACAVAIE